MWLTLSLLFFMGFDNKFRINLFLAILGILHLGLWGYLLSTDILCRPQFRRFLPSLLCCYVFSKWNIYFFILVFSDPILFCLFLFLYTSSLSSTFCLSLLSVFGYSLLSLSPTVSFFICLLLSFLLLSFFYLSSLIFFVYHLLSLSASVSLIVFYFLLGFLLLSFFACLLLYPPYSSLYLFGYVCFIIIIILFFFSVFSTFQFFLSAFSAYFSTYFFLFCFSYLVLFSTLFDYLVLILDFLLNIFPRFGDNAPVFLSLVSFSRIVVYILMETQSMAKFALISYGFLVFGNMLTTFFKSYQISQLFQRILPWLNSFMYISVFLNSKTYHNKCVYFSIFPQS